MSWIETLPSGRYRAVYRDPDGSATRKPATVRHAYALLSTILSDAVVEGLLLTKPCRFSRLPGAARYEAVYVSPAEVERLVESIDPAYRDLVVTADAWSCGDAGRRRWAPVVRRQARQNGSPSRSDRRGA